MNKLPSTITQLTSWIEQHYNVYYSPRRSFIDLPVTLEMNGQSTTFYNRICFVTVALRGRPSAICRHIAKRLEEITPREIFVDAAAPLFIRSPFEQGKNHESGDWQVYGRIAFWDNDIQKALLASDFIKKEGTFVPQFKLEEED